MKNTILLIVISIVLLILLVSFFIQINKKAEEKMANLTNLTLTNITLITIYDNYQFDSELKTGWGFGCVIKTNDKNILFDTGSDSETLLSNMEKLKIKPEEIDIVVLSHIHGDHVGGLSGFLEKNSNVSVFVPSSFSKSFKNEIKETGAMVVEISKEKQIEEGIYSTGELGTWIKEQSLFVNTNKGLIVITGCAHPGIVNIIKKVKELTGQEIYLVIGGFHLTGTDDSELKSIINSFRELDIKKVAPCHCSGDRCRELFKEEYKDDFIANGVGKIIEIN
jgi:7,8-dihydropterin-6-yl-methyl-4-(beta-D-ribofuranosyl)aminobenzene 5'-phosphate synthase